MEIWLIQGINSLRRTCRKWNSVYIELKFTTYRFLQCVFQSLQTLPLCVPYTVKWLALRNGKGQASDTNYKGAHTKSEYGQFTKYTRVAISTHTNPCHKANEVKLVSLPYENYGFQLGLALIFMSVCILWLRWARAFQDSVYHTAVKTINCVEALKRLLKYQYLSRQKHMTLSHIISNITEEFLPALHYKYIYENFKQCDLYRSYNPAVVPSYLQGRAKPTILHCLNRQALGNKFTSSIVRTSSSGKFEVQWVIWKPMLSILHYFLVAVTIYAKIGWNITSLVNISSDGFILFPQWGWEALPQGYQQSSCLNLDDQAISDYINNFTHQKIHQSLWWLTFNPGFPIKTDCCFIESCTKHCGLLNRKR